MPPLGSCRWQKLYHYHTTVILDLRIEKVHSFKNTYQLQFLDTDILFIVL